jgi:SAM-dependent methyltransferase
MCAEKILQCNWYDYPEYYDISFQSETPAEADFIEAACEKYCSKPARNLLEPACGTGRLVVELANRGYRVTGIDLNRSALDYLRGRLTRRALRARVVRGNMADFHLPAAVDAAFCTFDSFRHLLDERSALAHLQCVADALRDGGIYILGFHLLPPDADEECTERWTAKRGRVQVTATLKVLETNAAKRLETLRVNMLVRSGKKRLRLRDEFKLRMYTSRQFVRLLGKVPSFELCDVYDFWYEIDSPLTLDDRISDTVFILRKRTGSSSR